MKTCHEPDPDHDGRRCTLPARPHANHEDDAGNQWPNVEVQAALARRSPPKGAGIAKAERIAASARDALRGA